MENNNVNVNDAVEDKVEGGATGVTTESPKITIETEKLLSTIGEDGITTKEKTFTQTELDKILNKKFAQWQKKTEEAKAEAERKAKLTEAEKLAEERKEFESMKRQFEYEQRVNSTSKVLASNNLPIEFSDFLVADTEDATTQRVDLFKNAFNEAVEKLVNERLKGSVPKVSTGTKNNTISKQDFRSMSYKEKMDLYNNNKELFKKLSEQ